MVSSDPIFGKVKLFSGLEGMPCNGISAPKMRVELYEEKMPDSAWISELNVLGSLPWKEDEERRVEVRIMDDEFREYVSEEKPYLQVRRGSQHVGVLEIE